MNTRTPFSLNSCRFAIDTLRIGSPARGRIVSTQALDREEVAIYTFTLTARDGSNPPLSSSVPLTVSVQDQNDNRPLFNRSSWVFDVPENVNDTLIMEFFVSIASIQFHSADNKSVLRLMMLILA